MRNRTRRFLAVLAAAAAALSLGGCSRKVLNYQVAECIGTLNQYENNEPVETPKMQAEREQRESEEAAEASKTEILEQAQSLAQEHWYEQAISLLQNAENLQEDERAKDAIKEYQSSLDSLFEYDGEIGHLSFTNLVVDTDRAFDGDEYSQVYRENMITMSEFTAILDELYKSGYVLIDIHSLAEESDGGTDVLMTGKNPVIPQGRKPLVISIENLNYSSMRNGDGVATKLTLDDSGEVAAVYTDADGHELVGAYDVIPVLEQFIDEHPDFSYQGARGIISLSGVYGAFGYQVGDGETEGFEANEEKVKQIAEKLKEDGWTFASAGYSYQWMGQMNYDTIKEDITKWQSSIGRLIGTCDTLIYPYGSEVDYETEKAVYLIGQGFRYMVGLWAGGDHLEVNETYLRQTRRTVIGYVFEEYPNIFDTYFLTSAIKDSARNQ